jgi:hypothetical protein
MSEVSICNQALMLLGVDPITSLNDPTTQADICNRIYADVRNQVLEERSWTFATNRITLLPDAVAPDWGYGQKFLTPTTTLRVLNVWINPPQAGQEFATPPVPWNKEGRYILCTADKIYVKYTEVVEDTSLMSAAFKDCLAYRLAAEMAIPLDQNRTLMTDMQTIYSDKLKKSGSTDGAQGSAERKWVGTYVTRR